MSAKESQRQFCRVVSGPNTTTLHTPETTSGRAINITSDESVGLFRCGGCSGGKQGYMQHNSVVHRSVVEYKGYNPQNYTPQQYTSTPLLRQRQWQCSVGKVQCSVQWQCGVMALPVYYHCVLFYCVCYCTLLHCTCITLHHTTLVPVDYTAVQAGHIQANTQLQVVVY